MLGVGGRGLSSASRDDQPSRVPATIKQACAAARSQFFPMLLAARRPCSSHVAAISAPGRRSCSGARGRGGRHRAGAGRERLPGVMEPAAEPLASEPAHGTIGHDRCYQARGCVAAPTSCEREALAAQLLDSLEPPPGILVDDEDEIRRRAQQARGGVPWSEVKRSLSIANSAARTSARLPSSRRPVACRHPLSAVAE
jgi:hypothetical protein